MRWHQQVQRRSEISIAVISLVKVKGKRVFCREREKESARCTFHSQNTLYSCDYITNEADNDCENHLICAQK